MEVVEAVEAINLGLTVLHYSKVPAPQELQQWPSLFGGTRRLHRPKVGIKVVSRCCTPLDVRHREVVKSEERSRYVLCSS